MSPPRLTQPFEPITETGLLELVGKNEQIDQNDYTAAVECDLAQLASGEILHVTLYATETGSGAVLTPAGTLLILDADPGHASGATALTAAARITVIGQIPVAAADWQSDANGASVTVADTPIAFHETDSLFFVWFHEDATSINSAAGDDEVLQLNAWIRRDS
ncbi:MAG: hypothetical protein PVJ34_18865 [Anaerolineae bacterium]|jgi:hypothetical protein